MHVVSADGGTQAGQDDGGEDWEVGWEDGLAALSLAPQAARAKAVVKDRNAAAGKLLAPKAHDTGPGVPPDDVIDAHSAAGALAHVVELYGLPVNGTRTREEKLRAFLDQYQYGSGVHKAWGMGGWGSSKALRRPYNSRLPPHALHRSHHSDAHGTNS